MMGLPQYQHRRSCGRKVVAPVRDGIAAQNRNEWSVYKNGNERLAKDKVGNSCVCGIVRDSRMTTRYRVKLKTDPAYTQCTQCPMCTSMYVIVYTIKWW